jgi:phospholipid/cholesterol/gamma-HCH transport system ATP-binding protein
MPEGSVYRMPHPENSLEPAVTFDKVSKSFNGKAVLDNVSMVVPRGAIMVMLGPSGTGKSVMLRCLVGLMKPDAGRIHVFGEDITSLDENRSADRKRLFALRRRFGMLFQDGALFDDMSVGDNVAFPMRQHTSWRDGEIQTKVEENLARVGLAGKSKLMVSELSGGMRKRAAFARAIALRPDIILCDEPSSGLDPVMSATLDDLIIELHQELGITFIVISHDTAEARKIATVIGLLYQGKLQAFGPAKQVLNSNQDHVKQFFSRDTQGPIKVLS